jgi:hypothetical protein
MAMARFKLFRWKKRKKYPVNRDEYGRSARDRCFELFKTKTPINEIVKEVGVGRDTVYRYLRQYKQDPFLKARYKYAKSLFEKSAPDREKNVEMFADLYGFPKEQFEAILSQPHGLKRLLTRKLKTPREKADDHKRYKALDLALTISNFLIEDRGNYEDVYNTFRFWMLRQKQFREEEDAEILEENKKLEFFHKLIAKEVEEEQQGRVKPDLFSEEEQRVIMGIVARKKEKEALVTYWLRILEIMGEGSTEEQAREKLYKDITKAGDDKITKFFKGFQDKIPPLKPRDQAPPQKPAA